MKKMINYLTLGTVIYSIMRTTVFKKDPPKDLFLLIPLWGLWVPWFLLTLLIVLISNALKICRREDRLFDVA